jgi:hypothetical protein
MQADSSITAKYPTNRNCEKPVTANDYVTWVVFSKEIIGADTKNPHGLGEFSIKWIQCCHHISLLILSYTNQHINLIIGVTWTFLFYALTVQWSSFWSKPAQGVELLTVMDRSKLLNSFNYMEAVYRIDVPSILL